MLPTMLKPSAGIAPQIEAAIETTNFRAFIHLWSGVNLYGHFAAGIDHVEPSVFVTTIQTRVVTTAGVALVIRPNWLSGWPLAVTAENVAAPVASICQAPPC